MSHEFYIIALTTLSLTMITAGYKSYRKRLPLENNDHSFRGDLRQYRDIYLICFGGMIMILVLGAIYDRLITLI